MGVAAPVACDGDAIDTCDTVRPVYDASELDAFDALRGDLRRALAVGSAALVARAATASATLNQRHLPQPAFARCVEVARRAGAVGVATAHSGQVQALLFDPSTRDVARRVDLATRALEEDGSRCWRFTLA